MKKYQQILFYINNIPPDYGGGYLRAFKMAARFKDKNLLAGIITLTKKKQFIKTENTISIDDILFLKTKLFIIIELFVFLYSRRNSFDVIYVVSSHWHTFFAVLLCKILNKKVIIGITLSGVDSPAIRSSNIFINGYYRFKNLQFKLANKIVVNSPLVFDECIKEGFSKNKIEFIPNPVDIKKFSPCMSRQKRNNLREKIGIPLKNITILFVGSINARKGVDKFPFIFKQLLADNNNSYTLLLCGDLKKYESQKIIKSVEKIFEKNKNNSKFYFLGRVDNVYEIMKASDLFLFPTTNEGLPNVVIEAMASGLPVVASKLKGITDYLLEDIALANRFENMEFVKKINNLISNSSLYNQQIARNRKFIEDNMSNCKIDKLFLKL
tara:strand:- start:597 stop:1742 length:1146 start_codon:yes stop_codon:yes gene_type:complete